MSRVLMVLCAVLAAFVTSAYPAAAAPSAAAVEWKDGANASIGQLGEALTNAGIAMQNLDAPAMRTHCAELQTALDELEGQLPTPDPAATTAFSDSIGDYQAMTDLCMTVDLSNGAELAEMEGYVRTGSQRMYDGLAILGFDPSPPPQ